MHLDGYALIWWLLIEYSWALCWINDYQSLSTPNHQRVWHGHGNLIGYTKITIVATHITRKTMLSHVQILGCLKSTTIQDIQSTHYKPQHSPHTRLFDISPEILHPLEADCFVWFHALVYPDNVGRVCHNQGAVSIRKTVLPGMAIPMLKIRRPNGRLIFNMEIAIRR